MYSRFSAVVRFSEPPLGTRFRALVDQPCAPTPQSWLRITGVDRQPGRLRPRRPLHTSEPRRESADARYHAAWKARCAHAHLQRAERMLDRLAASAHRLRIFIEPSLRCFKNVLVLPSRNAPLVARRAFRFQRAIRAGVRPIAPHHLAVLLGRHVIGQLLAGRTAIDILGGVVDEVLLAETTIRLRA